MTTQRLPIPGQDDGTWGSILNGFLTVSHNADGTLTPSALTNAGALTTVNGKTPTSGNVNIGVADLSDVSGASSASNSQVLAYSTSSTKWIPSTVSSSIVNDATTGAKGIIQLAGDLGGISTTAAAPTLAATTNVNTIISANTTVAGAAQKSANLSDLASASTARTNLGLGTAATQASSAFDASGAATTVQAASLQKTSNLADLANASTARTNLGLGTAATISSSAGGDLSGTLPSPTVAKINGTSVPATPSAGQVLTATSGTAASWSTPIVGSQALIATAVKTTTYAATAGDLIPVDATSAGFTVTLPTAPADKSRVAIKKIDATANVVTITTGGSDVFNKTSGSTSLTLSLLNQSVNLQYAASTAIWYVVGDDLPLSQLDARYTTPAAITTDLNNTDANIFWNGTGSCPLRTTGTTDTTRRVRWIGPTAPLTTTGYALPGDVWETTT